MPVDAVPHDPTWPTLAPDVRPAGPYDPQAAASAELDRQVRAYLDLGVASAHGLDAETLTAAVAPLRDRLGDGAQRSPGTDPTGRTVPADDHVPFVLVLAAGAGHANVDAPAMRRGSKPGVSVIDDTEMAGYQPLEDAVAPDGPYLLLDIDTGTEFCGERPEDALVTVRGRGRVPLTVAEGVALATVRPDMLRPNRCFSLMGSRADNQRVPAVWISQRRAKLGWCWDRNPHTWLGAASAGGRAGA